MTTGGYKSLKVFCLTEHLELHPCCFYSRAIKHFINSFLSVCFMGACLCVCFMCVCVSAGLVVGVGPEVVHLVLINGSPGNSVRCVSQRCSGRGGPTWMLPENLNQVWMWPTFVLNAHHDPINSRYLHPSGLPEDVRSFCDSEGFGGLFALSHYKPQQLHETTRAAEFKLFSD